MTEFKSILDLINSFPTEQSCIDHLEQLRWNGNVVSPFNPESKVYKCKGNKYRCKETGKYFNVRTATIFDNTKIPLIKWFMALYVFSSHKKGISSHQLAKDISVTQKSAWFMLHRLRYAFDQESFKKIAGDNPVQIDESFIGGKQGNKHVGERSGAHGTKGKTPVMGMLEMNGNVVARVVKDIKTSTLLPIIYDTVKEGATIFTDELHSYRSLRKNYQHFKVDHSANQYVNDLATTNGIENFWSHMKRGLIGIYHWVSVPHLQAYVNEFTLRFNTRKYSTSDRFNLVLRNVAGRLTYSDLIGWDRPKQAPQKGGWI